MMTPTMIDARKSVKPATWHISWTERWDHFLARMGVNRGGHRIDPGLYALGQPGPDSPVLVTANYTLSFDALRTALTGIDCYVLVLDTMGINVWCAAGKGTFGTEEIVRRVNETHLTEIVNHRKLILPQLGAPGVAAHEIKKRCGFWVKYGPIRAADLPKYLKTQKATKEMRRVNFLFRDRLVLVPVEVVHSLLPMLVAAVILYLLGGWILSLASVAVVLSGTVIFPALLPWIPTRDFSSKGFILGAFTALGYLSGTLWLRPQAIGWHQVLEALALLLIIPASTAYITLNFTGSTPFTSRSGVRREIFRYIPVMAWIFGAGLLVTIAQAFIS